MFGKNQTIHNKYWFIGIFLQLFFHLPGFQHYYIICLLVRGNFHRPSGYFYRLQNLDPQAGIFTV